MSYKSHRKALLIATVSALALGTILSLGAVYGLNKQSEPDEQTVGSATFKKFEGQRPPG
jgi:hypothetical protein